MSYTFKNTERNNEKASVFETKSLLYLIGKRIDSKEIEYVTFDCFNDVSGLNKKTDSIWDIQSKNEKTLNPKKIGKYFYTLFDNFSCIFSFREFIFFAPPIDSRYKIDPSLSSYKLSNINLEAKVRIRQGLLEEVKRVKGDLINYEPSIDEFLKAVIIVEDNCDENDYIRSITKFKNTDLKSDEFYKNVFLELRNIQSSKKNTYIENATISEIRDVLKFNRHLQIKDIETLIVSRIIGCEVFRYFSIPIYFSPLIDGMLVEDKKDLLDECNSNLSRAFFNKNSNKVFWSVCEEILIFFTNNNSNNVNRIFNEVFVNFKCRVSYLNEITIKYLISIIIEGRNDN